LEYLCDFIIIFFLIVIIIFISDHNSFFTELNDQLFSTLFEAENAEIGFDIHSGVSSKRKETSCIPRRQIKSQKRRFQTKVVQNEIIKRAGLDPSDEKEFLSEVLKFYDFNLKVS